MPVKIYSAAVVGLDSQIIEVEVDACYGLPRFNIVGLADKAVEESKERISSAVKTIGFKPPHHNFRVLVNLAPADLKKQGSLYDLPIALGFLLASKQISFDPEKMVFVGELSLDAKLRPIKGAVLFGLIVKEKAMSHLVLPQANALEASLINKNQNNIKIIASQNLAQVIERLQNTKNLTFFETAPDSNQELKQCPDSIDFSWIKGQESAKRALEIAAAGGHNLLMTGPPGAGKSLLAKAIPSILPRLSFEESLELTKIYSVAGLLPKEQSLVNSRPFRSPHHTCSEPALIGGGSPPRPGEITLAHRGVLFLDEFPEFHRDVLESLRQPIEEGKISISRARYYQEFPAKFMLVAATNPCPCGFKDDSEKECVCVNSQIAKYRRKLSGPLMDRLDLFVNVGQIKYEKLIAEQGANQSDIIRARIEKARQIQRERFASPSLLTNSDMTLPQIKKHCCINNSSNNLLKKFVDSGQLSSRGYHRVLKVARTIADLALSEQIQHNHLSEALMFRLKDQQ